jgi:hypothetical protein
MSRIIDTRGLFPIRMGDGGDAVRFIIPMAHGEDVAADGLRFRR